MHREKDFPCPLVHFKEALKAVTFLHHNQFFMSQLKNVIMTSKFYYEAENPWVFVHFNRTSGQGVCLLNAQKSLELFAQPPFARSVTHEVAAA